MRVRTVYMKVRDMKKVASFWQSFFSAEPVKSSSSWTQFSVAGLNIALLLNDFNAKIVGSNCVPVFEMDDAAVLQSVARAREHGAVVVLDGLEDPSVRSIVLRDPVGNEFEIRKSHGEQ
jgi:catechol-2,3-dioxygenase